MPNTRVRVVGSGFSSFNYNNAPIAFLEGVEDSGQRAFSDLGQGYQFIHPLNDDQGRTATHPVEIATSRVLAGGTLQLTIRELWNQTVWNQLAGLAGTNNIVDVFRVLAANPQYVTCTQIIRPPAGTGNPRGKVYHNCFRGDTEYLTQEGIKTLEETVGTTQKVLGKGGAWKDAEILSYGYEETRKITFTRQGRKKVVYATGNHRFPVNQRHGSGLNQRRLVTTTTDELAVGDHVINRFARWNSSIVPQTIGIQAGIVFGDGTMDSRGSKVSLWGNKDAALLKLFPSDCRMREIVSANGVPGIEIKDLPGFFKKSPDLTESRGYLLGWLMGYFAADGTVDRNGHARFTSRNIDSIKTARTVCDILGVPHYDISESNTNPGYNGEQPSYTLTMDTTIVGDEFFLINEHQNRVSIRNSHPVKSMPEWIVESVEKTGILEEVFCARVPDGEQFTLAGNLGVLNCVVVDINDGDTITIGALAVTKGITVAYTHSELFR